ncbi:MAG: acyl-CoA desaturase [Cytophagales bacterium]|nr:MAG: acyl-CoA desaturase [Cytophagales bacterium]
MSKTTFNNKQNPFFKSLKEKVDCYFKSNNIKPSGNAHLYFKGVILVGLFVASYIVLVFYTPSIFIALLLCVLMGINMGAIGFNVMHEGGHGSFSSNKFVNEIAGYFLNVLGGNIYFWKVKHNINHHTFTNIEGLDSDIDILPFMRVNEHQPKLWFHKFQYIYWFFLYGISYFVWIYYEDYVKYFNNKIGNLKNENTINLKEHLVFWFTKIAYSFVFIVLPLIYVGLWQTILGFCIVSFVCGTTISIVFQMAHVVEDTDFPLPNSENKIDQEWALHQISTTANFSTRSKFVSWLLGGLNFQVEHHLFPKISHVHYPKINLLVKETCEQFGVKYIEYSNVYYAFSAHIKHIKRLGV